MAKLKIWNGNAQTMVPHDERVRYGLPSNGYVHGYGCAKSRAALCRMIIEWSGKGDHGLDSYVKDYWSEGAWGNAMAGVEPEEGLWIAYGYGESPVRVIPKPAKPAA